jgi:type I restriction enzyme R subunit
VSGASFAESIVEEAGLAWLANSGFSVAHGPDIAFGQPGAERSDPTYRDVVLQRRLREALVRLNPELPQDALDDAFRKVVRPDGPSLIKRNRAVHRMLVNGVTVEYHRPGEPIRGAQARVIDFDDPDNNDWLAVNQFTVVGPQGHNRRADIVIFLNGLPLGVIELKNPADEKATIGGALNQLQTYQSQIPALFDYNCALVVSDGTEARIGALGAGKEWFKPWRTVDTATRKRDLQVRGEVATCTSRVQVRVEVALPWPVVAESATTRPICSTALSRC